MTDWAVTDWHWSPSRASFFPGALRTVYEHAGTWPDDAVAVSDEVHAAANPMAPDGKRIAADAKGNPVRVPLELHP